MVQGGVLAFNTIAGIATTSLLAHALGKESVGIFGWWFRLFAWFSAAAVFVVPVVLIKYTAELNANSDGINIKKLLKKAFRFQLGTIAVVVAVALGYWTMEEGESLAILPLSLVLLAFVFYAIEQVYENSLKGLQRFGMAAVALVAGTFVKVSGLVILLLAGGGVIAALAVHTLAQLTALVLAMILSTLVVGKLANSPRKTIHKDELSKRILSFAKSMGGASLLTLVVWGYVEVFFIGWMWKEHPDLPAQLAYYTLAIALASFPIRVTKAISTPLLPAFAELSGRGEMDRFIRGYRDATIISTMVGLYFCAITAALAEPIVGLLFPAELSKTATILQILLIPAACVTLTHAANAAIPALDGHKFLFRLMLVSAIGNLILDIWLIPRWGAVGAASINAITQGGTAIAGAIWLYTSKQVSWPIASAASTAIPCVVISVLAWYGATALQMSEFSNIAILLILLPATALIYFPLVYSFCLKPELKRQTLNMLGNYLPKSVWLAFDSRLRRQTP